MSKRYIGLGEGAGGQEQHELIAEISARLNSPALAPLEDSAVLDLQPGPGEALLFTTDSYVVSPFRFPGGDVGKLAVCGTVNDLAVMGALPRYLSCGIIVEEGTLRDDVLAVAESMAQAAAEAGVQIATGDTKVVERGSGDGIFINTSGIGLRPARRDLGSHRIEPGQVLIVNGTLGDHAVAVLCSRPGMDFTTDIVSDCAPLNGLVEVMLAAAGSGAVAAMRDLTRGGLAAVLNEYAAAAQCDMLVEEAALPVKPAVRAIAKALGFEPAVLANEGKLLAVVDAKAAEAVLAAMLGHPLGWDAAVIGEVGARFNKAAIPAGHPRSPVVILTTLAGGKRALYMPLGELVPRIC